MDNLRIYLSTWNVATNSPSQDLNALLDFPSVENKHRPLPDFYILGFQEVKSQPQNVVMDAIFSDPWTAAINKLLVKHSYVRVKSIRLQGLLLLVLCLRKHLVHLRDVEAQYTRTGLGGMWGNKGAVSVRLSVYGCSICVVNSHLSPHDHQLDERVADYNNIIKSNTFHIRDTSNIMFHDYVFWLGDLNFRLSERAPESSQQVLSRILAAEEDFSSLLQYDQLRGVMASGDAFSELTETLPRFPPTFKFEIGTSKYDEKRRPAWTDRILYKVVPDNYENVTLKADQLNYHSLPQYTISDHKPVVSEFIIKVFSNYTERCVEFAPISSVWFIGDADFIAKYTLSSDVLVYPNDWIAVYEADFDNLEDYITYEYVTKVGSAIIPGGNQSRTVVFSFPVGSGVRSPGWYRFLYFSQPSSDVRSLLGISDPFEARVQEEEERSPSRERPPSEEQLPSASGASSSGQEARGMDSILKDFSNLHVPGLKFNMLNDLSID